MANDTVWGTAHDLLASLNAYKRGNPEVLIISADRREPEPMLTWVAYIGGLVDCTWSIPLRMFRSTISRVKIESYQGHVDRLDIERRILKLTKDPKEALESECVMASQQNGFTELHRSFGENENWKVNRDCVYLNGERILNGCEIGYPSDGGRRYVSTVRKALALRDEFDAKFPEGKLP